MRVATNNDQDLSSLQSLARGTEVGRFVVLGLLGRGAMGEVYAAYDPELDRKVAIKLLRMASDRSDLAGDGRSRLIREAQAIAKVSHPNVVVVYDVGTFDGRVFIAMEFVEGHTLGYWLLSERRSLEQILEAFAAAGRGLGAAHEKELVHRDFKPENVMVAIDGQVRVMDFGLARLSIDRDKTLEKTPNPEPPRPVSFDVAGDPFSTRILDVGPSSATAASPSEALTLNLTQEGAIMGTPAYMSPEQFRGEPTDARTDQFSFCVALYEALYGERPFAALNIAEFTANVIAGRVRPEPTDAHVPTPIRRALLRGLSPDREQRFASMRALLVALGQEQARTGARRFADGAAAKLAGVWEAPDGEQSIDTEAKVQIRQAFLATGKPYAAATFDLARRILDRFAKRWSELYVDACEATHVRGEQSTEVLDLRMGALGEALEDLRALCWQFRRATSEIIENAVNAASALGTLERCADVKLLRAIVRPPDDPDKRAAVEQLQVRLSEVRALGGVGRIADGLKRAVALERDARLIGYAPLLAEVLFTSGIMHHETADADTAARIFEDAAWTAELCRHDEVAAQAATSLVFVTGYRQSRFDVADIWSRHAQTVLSRMGGHPLIRGWLFNNRGAMRAIQGRLSDAIDDILLAIAEKEKALGPDDPDVGMSLGNAAIYFDELGDLDRAATYAERAVRIVTAALGLDHPKVATQLTNYAEILNRLGRFREAREAAQQALSVFERETDPEAVYVSYPLLALAVSHIAVGEFEAAIAPLERAARIRTAKEKVPAKLAEVLFGLARALAGAGRDLPRAMALADRARAEYLLAPATPATERELREIDRWLERQPLRAEP